MRYDDRYYEEEEDEEFYDEVDVDDYYEEDEYEDEYVDEYEENQLSNQYMQNFKKRTAKNAGKATAKAGGKIISGIAKGLGKLITMIPPQVWAVILIIVLILIAIIFIFNLVTEASTDTVDNAVNYSVSSMESSVSNSSSSSNSGSNSSSSSGSNSGSASDSDSNSNSDNQNVENDLTPQQIEQTKKAVEFFKENNSYLYFTIEHINNAYNDFIKLYEDKNGDVTERVYKSLSTEFGTEDIESETSRLVSVEQKQELYKHLLMTEKYDFNKIEWKRYGHGYNGEESPMIEDKELGLKYPNDGVNKIDTFISLASPYMLTWHIPLGFHSGYMTKSGSSESASKFTYSIIKEASSKIIAHRYDVQKYILNTKFNDYIETEYKTKFKTNVDITYKYTPQTYGENNYELDETTLPDSTEGWENTGIIFYRGSYPYGQSTGATVVEPYLDANGNSNVKNIIHQKFGNGGNRYQTNIIVYPNEDLETAINNTMTSVYGLIEGENDVNVIQYKLQGGGSGDTNYAGGSTIEKLFSRKFTCTISMTISNNHVKDDDGNTIYDKSVSYEYTSPQILEPSVLSTEYVNERYNDNDEIDPMLEEEVNSNISIDNRYYINKAKTFDVEIANTFNYVKYNEEHAANRIKPKSEKETKVEDFKKIENEENDLNLEEIKDGYLYQSLTYLESIFDIESRAFVSSSNSNDTTDYDVVKDSVPGEIVSLGEVIPGGNEGTYTELRTYQITYVNKNSYTVKEGKAEEGKGTHYIQRQWEDRLTQLSSVTTAYDEEDLVDFNAEYNAKLNGTTVEEEKEAFEEIAERAEKNYSEYKGLAVHKLLNTIEFVNSNENMFKEYMDDMSPQSKIRGYSRAYIEFCMREVKRLFKETEDKNGTIPYVYGVSLGFTNVLENSNLNKVSNSHGMFLWPVEQNEYVGFIFGYTPAYGSNPHTGIDISYPADYEVRASAAGTIIEMRNIHENDYRDTSSFGNYIKIDHGNGYSTLYAHLLKNTSDDAIADFAVGSTVEKGQVIGYTGSTGYSTGTHLHYEIRYDADGNGAFPESERIDPLEFFVVEPTSENIPEYDELLTNYELRYEITAINPYKFVGYPYNADGMDLSKSELEKEEFVSLAEKNLSSVYGLSSTSEFYKELGNMYDYCQDVGVNPEYAIVTAVLEHSALDGYGVHNYWNIGVGNDDSPTVEGANESFEEALAEFCDLILSYRDPSSSAYNSIMARYEEREAAGCNPEGYGTPDTLAGIQSIYSWLGSDHTGDNAGEGGMYYINIPGVIYETQEEIEEKCWSKHGTEGGKTSTEPTTIEEQNNYTAYGVRAKLAIRNKIFEY